MEQLVALLLIVGCSDDLAVCTELPAPAPLYETAEECERSLPPAMRGYMHDFPQILAKCIPVDPALEETSAEIVWDINPEGDLIASVEPRTEYNVAAHRSDRQGD